MERRLGEGLGEVRDRKPVTDGAGGRRELHEKFRPGLHAPAVVADARKDDDGGPDDEAPQLQAVDQLDLGVERRGDSDRETGGDREAPGQGHARARADAAIRGLIDDSQRAGRPGNQRGRQGRTPNRQR